MVIKLNWTKIMGMVFPHFINHIILALTIDGLNQILCLIIGCHKIYYFVPDEPL